MRSGGGEGGGGRAGYSETIGDRAGKQSQCQEFSVIYHKMILLADVAKTKKQVLSVYFEIGRKFWGMHTLRIGV